MKKLIFIAFACFLFIPFKVQAADFSTSITGTTSITSGSTFTVNFNANSGTGLYGIIGKLNYDSSKLNIVSSSGLNGYNLVLGTNLVLDNTTSKSGSFSFASITFKATSSFQVGETSAISISNVTGSDGTNDLTGTGSSLAITVRSTNNNLSSLTVNGVSVSGFSSSKTSYSLVVENKVATILIGASLEDGRSSLTGTGTKSLNVYGNTFYVTVTAENGSKKTYTINVNRKDEDGLTAPKSTNNNLNSLTIEGYPLNFLNTTLEYSLTVENNVSSLNIGATLADSKSTLVIDKSDSLKVGDNIINVTVTAENGSKKVYKLLIKRKSEGPTTTIGEFLSIVDKTTTSTINIDIKDKITSIPKNIISAIKTNNKKIIVSQYSDEKVLYKWEINGSSVDTIKDIDTLITITNIDKKLDELTNYANNLYLDFAYSGLLPKNTYIDINVSDKFANGDKIKLYYYNESKKLVKIYDDIKVENGYVHFKLEHCSNYILSKADYKLEAINLYLIYIAVIAILLIIIIILIVRTIIVNKKLKRNLMPKTVTKEEVL